MTEASHKEHALNDSIDVKCPAWQVCRDRK